jgi:hypothetical protein
VKFTAGVSWLDEDGEDLGLGLLAFVPRVGSAPDGEWGFQSGITDEAPLGARRARLSLASGDGCGVLVDDAAFYRSE